MVMLKKRTGTQPPHGYDLPPPPPPPQSSPRRNSTNYSTMNSPPPPPRRNSTNHRTMTPPPPPPPPPTSATYRHHPDVSTAVEKDDEHEAQNLPFPSLRDHVGRLQAELDAAMGAQPEEEELSELRRSGGSRRAPPAAPPSPRPPPRSASSYSVDRPPTVIRSNVSSSSMDGLVPDSLSLSSAGASPDDVFLERGPRRSASRGYHHREQPHGVGEGGGGAASTMIVVNVLIAVIAAILGCFGGYVMSHRHHSSDIIMQTFHALDTMQRMQHGKDAIPKEDKVKVEMAEVKQDSMRSHLTDLEYRKAVKKYGDDPHRIMFSLEFPAANSNSKPERQRFFIETVPLRFMPHSVLTFLDMVEAGLYNGVQFNVVTRDKLVAVDFGHNLVAAASDRILKRLERADKLESALFYKEYNPNVMHMMGTMGFLDRGPGLFVSMVPQNRIKMEGHPCFGRVVEGLDVLNTILEKGAGALANPVTIRIAKIVPRSSPN